MNLQTQITYVLLALAALLVVASQAFFTVDQREQAIVLQLGQPKGEIRGPGLHVKLPFIQEVRYFDRRILAVDPDPEQVVISSATFVKPPEPKANEPVGLDNQVISGEPIIVDTFGRYKITDPLQFLKTLRSVSIANQRIENILNDATRTVLGKTTLRQLLSADRAAVMNEIRARVNTKAKADKLGIEIVDVRIVRADLTSDLRTSTVRRMISELTERATETRANGEQKALEIRSTADKERTVLLAEAERDAQVIRGEGDQEAIGLYALAFNKDKDFYAFMRSLEAYKSTLADPDTQLILSPDSDFLRFFDNRSGQ